MKRATKSLLEELNSISIKKNSEAIIESRANHIINSAINFMSLVRETFTTEEAQELERRLINSIRSEDPNKFIRGIRKLRDGKNSVQRRKIDK